MNCPPGTQICVINGGGGTAWWLTALQIAIPAVAVVVAAILTQTISARRTREREQAATRALTQRETARDLSDRMNQAWQEFTEYDRKPPAAPQDVQPHLSNLGTMNSLSYRLDDQETGAVIREWILLAQNGFFDRLNGQPPASSAEWDKIRIPRDEINRRMGLIYRAPTIPERRRRSQPGE